MKNAFIFLLLLIGFKASSQTCQMSFTNPTYNSGTGKFRATLTISSTSGNNAWELGNMNLRFNYPISALSTPVIAVNHLSGSGFSYGSPTTTGSNLTTGVMSYNITLPSGTAGKPIPTTGFDILTIEWNVTNAAGLSSTSNKLEWRAGSTFTNPRLAIVTSTQTVGCPAGCGFSFPPSSALILSPLIQAATPLSVSIAKTDQTSCSAPNGTATATAAGGTSPYTYLWSNGATSASISNLSAGSYSVTVTDNAAGTATASATISGPAAISGTASSITSPSCIGSLNGSVVITPSGGTAPYTIVPAQTGLAAGSYQFTITGANGCTGTVSANIPNPTPVTATITALNNVSCFGSMNGSVTITASGGTGPYSISPAQSGLGAGLYTFTVTDSKGCTTTVSATVSQPSQVSATITGQTNVTCFGSMNGSVSITASGGTAPYSISPAQTGLAAGSYTFTVTDAKGCSTTVSATISQPSQVSASITGQTNATCFGSMNGSVSITASGGTAPYAISPAQTGLAAGAYTFTITDSNGCSTTVTAIISQPSAMVATVTGQTDANCGQAVGSVTISVTGGASPYSIAPAQTGLAAGPYTFTVTDANGCTTTVSAVINSSAGLTVSAVAQHVSCFGGADGSVNVSVSGGAAPYSIIPAQTGLSAGNYTFTITDATGCSATASATVDQPAQLTAQVISQVNVSCFGSTNGSVSINAVGGTAPYSISPAQSGLGAGSYAFTVTDAKGCSTTVSATITEPAQLAAVISAQSNASCFGSMNGSVSISASGGTAPYSISPSQTGLGAGSYTFTITDANGCNTTVSATISQPDALAATVTGQTNANCGQNVGSVSIGVTGGTAPYSIAPVQTGLGAGSYSFTVTDASGCTTTVNATVNSTSGLIANATAQNTSCFGGSDGSVTVNVSGGTAPYSVVPAQTGLSAGAYTFTVTDATGCSVTTSATVGQPTAVTAVVSGQTNAACFGSLNGSVTISATGGTAPYTITPSQTGLGAGSYTFTVTDFAGCTTTVSATITQPSQMVSDIASQTNVTCNGGNNGSVSFNTTGGVPPYSVAPSTSGLAAGAYQYTITDANGCTNTVQVNITQPAAISASVITETPVNCAGGSDGSVTLAISGGSAPYALSSNAGTVNGNTVSGLAAGQYTFTITDVNGCVGSATVGITSNNIIINANAGADVTLNCQTTSATLTATGGASYLWSNGETTASITVSPSITTTYSVTVTGATGCTGTDEVVVTVDTGVSANAGPDVTLNCITTSTTLTATGAGTFMWSTGETTASITVSPSTTTTYIVTVTAGNGCIASDAVIVTVDNAAPNGSAGPDGVINCVISSATLNATGGATYAWSNGATTASITVIPTVSTDYSVTITGANGCTSIDVATVVVDKTPPNANAGPDVIVTSSNPTATLVASGGVSYQWSNGVTTATNVVTPTQTTSYAVTVTGANGCKSTDIVLVTVERKVNLSFGNPQIIGNKFRFTIRLSSTDPFGIGSSNFRFNYNQNALSGLTIVSDVFPSPDFGNTTLVGTSQTTGIASVNTAYTGATNSGLVMINSAGVDVATLEFTITNPLSTANLIWRTTTTPKTAIVDDDKISSITLDQVTNLNYPLSTVSISALNSTNNACFGAMNGTAQVTAVGGLQPYSYRWSNGATTASVSNLAAGVYTVSVTDAVPVTVSQSVTITEPSEIIATYTASNATCFGSLNGSVTFAVSGGVAPYSIVPAQTGLAAGNYVFTVTDANNCSKTVPVNIQQPQALTASVTSTTNVTCFGALNGSVVVTATGGTTPYSIVPAQTGLAAGTYTFTVTDANGCTTTTTATVQQPAALAAAFTQKNVTCLGGNDGAVTFTPDGGTAPYTVTPSQSGLSAGNYNFTITDANGCSTTQQVTILDGYQATVNAGADVTVNCANPSATLSTTESGSYMWSNGSTTASTTVTPSVTTTYTLSFTDVNGCKATDDVKVTVDNTAPIANAGADVTVNCTNPSTVLNATGGVSYIWNNGTLQGESVSPSVTTIYTVTVTGANGCTATAIKKVTADKTAPLANAGPDVTVTCTTPSTVLSATGGVSYIWNNGTQQGGSVTPLVTTTYTVTVTGANGCTAVDDKVVVADKVTIANAGPDVTTNCTNPTATLTATGGTSFVWSSGSLSSTITVNPLTTTTYSVTVTGANGCKGTDEVVVTVDKATPSGSAGPNGLVNCNISSATLTASGGVSYLWNTGATTASITASPTVTTNYTVIVTGANTCTTSAIASIIVDKAPPAANAGPDLTFNAANPTVTLVASGGVSYLWSNGVTTASNTVTPTQAGTYTVTVTGVNGCTASDNALVTFGRTVNLAFVQPQIIGNKFRVTLRLSAPETFGIGSSNFRFNYNNAALSGLTVVSEIFPSPAFGATSLTGTSQSTGIASVNTAYTGASDANLVTITPAGVDVAVLEFTITNPALSSNLLWRVSTTPRTSIVDDDKLSNLIIDQLVNLNFPLTPFQITSLTKTDNLCFGASNGTAQVTVQNGLAPYSYLWSNGATTAAVSGLAAGTYTVSVTDASPNTISQSITITEPLALTATHTQSNVTCNGLSNGSVSIIATGGVAPYTIVPAQTGLAAGSYTFTVTDANGCTTTLSVDIQQPDALTASLTQSNVTCNGGNNGSVSVTVNGGSAPYSIAPAQTGLVAGSYTFTVTDANGCSTSLNATITEPAALTATFTQTNVSCAGGSNGSVDFAVAGGTAPYSISPAQNNLPAGSYTFTITDSNGCSITQQVAILDGFSNSVNAGPDVTVNCITPSATLTATGGSGSYLWSNGETSATISVSPVTTTTYSVTVTSVNGCTATDEVVVTADKTAPTADAGVDVTITCTNPTAVLTATGQGSYSWSNGESNASISVSPSVTTTYTVVVTAPNGCSSSDDIVVTVDKDAPQVNAGTDVTITCANPTTVLTATGGVTYTWSTGESTASITVAPAVMTTYSVTATGANGCKASDNVVVSVDKTAPIANAGLDVTIAYGGSANLTATGGVSYAWSNGANTATTTVSPVNRTIYSVTVTGANGCKASDDVIVSVEKRYSLSFVNSSIIGNKFRFTIRMSTNTPFCVGSNNLRFNFNKNALNGLTIISDAYPHPAYGNVTTLGTSYTSGIASVNVAYTGPASACLVPITSAGTDLVTCEFTIINPALSTQFVWRSTTNPAISVVADDKLTVCLPDVLTGLNAPLTPMTLTGATKQDVFCYGSASGSASVTVSGGLLPYTYLWSNGATTQSISNVVAGTYGVTVNDAFGNTVSTSVTINTPAASVFATSTQTNVTCNGGNNGSVVITATGGTTPYTITPAQTGLSAGTYTFTVTDASGCTTSVTTTITEPSAVVASLTQTNVTCNGGNNGSVVVSATGGVPPYTIAPAQTGLNAGTYTFTVTDASGCTGTVSTTITEPAAIALNVTANNVTCNGALNGSLDINSSGGTGALETFILPVRSTDVIDVNGIPAGSAAGCGQFCANNNCIICINLANRICICLGSFSNSNTSLARTNLAAGDYTVFVVDDNGCVKYQGITISQPSPLTAGISQTNVSCNGGSNGSVTVTANGGTAPYSVAPLQSGLSAGSYTFTVTDANGCSTTVSATITEPAVLTSSTAKTDVLCYQGSTGAIDLSVAGGVTPYAYSWSNGANSEDISDLTGGTYMVTVTDANGCSTTNEVQINTPSAPFTTNAGADVTINCSNPSTVLTAIGGDSFVWDNGATQGGSVSPTTTTTYTVTATLFGICTATDQVTVYADFEAPIANAGPDQTLDCSPSYTLNATGNGTYLWSTGETTATIVVDPTAETVYSVTVTAANGCTDVDEMAFIDDTPPVFASTFPVDLTINCHDASNLPGIDDVVIDIVDDCNVFVVGDEVSTRTASGCGSTSYVITRTWTAYDASGNSSTRSQNITVIDVTAPTFTSFPPASGGNYTNETTPRPAVLTAVDNCSAVTIVLDSVVVKNPLNGCQSYNNTVTRRWTAYDACGNSTEVTQTFNTAGLILLTCPADKTLSTNSDGSNNYNCSTLVLASDNLRPNFADLCDISNVLKFSVGGATILSGNGSINGNSLNRGVNNVTYTINSVSGNQSCSFKVTVVDNERPKFNTPPNVILDACVFPATFPVSTNPVAFDNCATPTLSVVSDVTADESSSCASRPAASKYIRSLTRTWMATDASGNTATVVQKIFLRDQIAPVASCKTGVIINISSTNITVPASTFNNTSSDNCTPAASLQFLACRGTACTSFAPTVTFSPSLIPTGSTQIIIPVSMRVIDACGNASVCTVNMTLRRSTNKLENSNNLGNKVVDTQDTEKSITSGTTIPSEVVSGHGEMKCFPNPFSDDLNIQYSLTNDEAQVVMKVYDNQGKVVKLMDMSTQYKGLYSVRWNLSDLDSGMYHVCLELGGKCTRVERVVLMK